MIKIKSDLIDIIHQEINKSPQHKSELSNINFTEISNLLKKINVLDNAFERMKKAQNSTFYRIYMKILDEVRSAGGMPQYYDDFNYLFEMKINYVNKIHRISDRLLKNTITEHERLSKVYEESIDEQETIYNSKKELSGVLEERLRKYQTLKEESKGMEPDSNAVMGYNYFQMKKELKNLERELDMRMGEKYVIDSKEINVQQISKFYENMETLLRHGKIMSESIKESSRDIVKTLDNTYKTYKTFNNVFGAVAACNHGLMTVANHQQMLHERFLNGLNEMSQYIELNPGADILLDRNQDLAAYVSDVQNAQNVLLNEKESKIKYEVL